MPRRKGHLPGVGLEVNPAILEFAGGILGKRCQRPVVVGRQEQPGLEDGLKAIADAEDQLAGVAEAAQGVAKEVGQLVGEDLAGRDVIAVSKAAGNDEHLITLQEPGGLAQAIDVDTVGMCTSLLERELRFGIAICTRSP